MGAARIHREAELAIVGDRLIQIGDRNDNVVEPEARLAGRSLVHGNAPRLSRNAALA
jgi:hypothetical protein